MYTMELLRNQLCAGFKRTVFAKTAFDRRLSATHLRSIATSPSSFGSIICCNQLMCKSQNYNIIDFKPHTFKYDNSVSNFVHYNSNTLTNNRRRCLESAYPLKRNKFLKSNAVICDSSRYYSTGNQFKAATTQKKQVNLQEKPLLKPKKRKRISKVATTTQEHTIVAYPVGENIDLELFRNDLPDGYEQVDPHDVLEFSDEKVLMLRKVNELNNNQPCEIFLFEFGAVVFWNMTESWAVGFLDKLRSYIDNSYDDEMKDKERDELNYSVADDDAADTDMTAPGAIQLQHCLDADSVDVIIDKFTISKPLALSVQLACNEDILQEVADRLEDYIKDMQKTSGLMYFNSRKEQLLVKHFINCGSDIMEDDPDYYWEDHMQKKALLYKKIWSYLSIPRRLKFLNNRLEHCGEVLDLMREEEHHRHSSKLEWIIIILILVEVVIAIFPHFGDDFIKDLHSDDVVKSDKLIEQIKMCFK